MDNCQSSICNRRNLNLLRDRGRRNIAAMACTSQPDMDVFDCGFNNSNIYGSPYGNRHTGHDTSLWNDPQMGWYSLCSVKTTHSKFHKLCTELLRCSQMFPISHRNPSCISWCHVQRTQQHVWFFVFFSAQTSSTNISTNTLSRLEGVGKRWSPEARTS